MGISIKRVYEKATRTDGTRILVDRLWPRGLSKENARIHAWLRELAPSNELRQWYHAHPQAWTDFRKRYLKELMRPETEAGLEQLHELAIGNKHVTLLFASRNETRNNAVVLKELLEGMRKPPTGTGRGGVKSVRLRQVAKRGS